MNKATTILLGFSLLVLGGAFFASRALLSDIPVPPPPALPPPPVAVAPPAPVPAPSAPVVAQPPPLPTDVAVVAPPPPEAPVAPAPPPPTADPDSDYAKEDSPQVEEAWKLAQGKDPAGWRTAEKLFKRCLAQAPDNQRCQSGLAAVQGQLSLGGARPVADTPPTSKTPRPRHDKNYVE